MFVVCPSLSFFKAFIFDNNVKSFFLKSFIWYNQISNINHRAQILKTLIQLEYSSIWLANILKTQAKIISENN